MAAPAAKGLPQQVVDDAHFLVLLKSRSVQDSSKATYASGLHRWIKWGQDRVGLSPGQVLPPGPLETINTYHVQLFLSYAACKYKPTTIRSTLDALRHWCTSKGVSAEAINNATVNKFLKTIQVQQGPTGLPSGKVGMPKPLLALLIAYCASRAWEEASQASLMHRDMAWLVLGFFGFLRRSELVALRMKDVSLSGTSGQPYISMLVRRSKTDPAGAGAQVVMAGTVGGWDLASKVRRYIDKLSPCTSCTATPARQRANDTPRNKIQLRPPRSPCIGHKLQRAAMPARQRTSDMMPTNESDQEYSASTTL